MKKLKAKPVATSQDKLTSMILRLTPPAHTWVKHIADATELALPLVINLILDEAMKHAPDAYINQVRKAQNEQRAKSLAKQIEIAKAELERLQTVS